MRILGLRLGHCCNSSSSHSIIIFDKDNKIPKPKYDEWWFGRQPLWILSNEESKNRFFAINLFYSLVEIAGIDVAQELVREFCNLPGFDGYKVMDNSANAHIDHGSVEILPKGRMARDLKGLDLQFASEYRDFLLKNSVIVVGGSDEHEDLFDFIANTSGQVIDPPFSDYTKSRARKDHGYWTIFNVDSGDKIRITFDRYLDPDTGKYQDPGRIEPGTDFWPLAPEIVDIKVTDKCLSNCPFCYQNSGPNGQHAKKDHIYSLIDALANIGVFEVAVGGGEPTLWPHLVEFLRYCKQSGIVANLSTRSFSLFDFENRELFDEIVKNCGKVAFSILSLQEAKDFVLLLDKHPRYRHSIQVQVVAGVFPTAEEFVDVIDYIHGQCYLPITVLGYKLAGRAAAEHYPDSVKKQQDAFIAYLTKTGRAYGLSIDTTLASRIKGPLLQLGVDERLYSTDERFSWYIDLVSMRHGPASYEPTTHDLYGPSRGLHLEDAISMAYYRENWAQEGINR